MPDAVRTHRASGLYETLGLDAAAEFLIHALEGALHELDGRYDDALSHPDGRHEMPGLRAAAHGRTDEALAALHRSRTNPPHAYNWLATLSLQAWLTSELAAQDLRPHDREALCHVARDLLAELDSHADRVAALGTFLIAGPVSLWIARLRSLLDGPVAGRSSAAAALRQAERTGMAPFARLARALLPDEEGTTA